MLGCDQSPPALNHQWIGNQIGAIPKKDIPHRVIYSGRTSARMILVRPSLSRGLYVIKRLRHSLISKTKTEDDRAQGYTEWILLCLYGFP